MTPINRIHTALEAQKLMNSIIQSEHSKLVGAKVKINDKYAQWMEAKIDEVFATPGSSTIEETESYKFWKHNIKKRFVGEVKASRFDCDGITLTVKFKVKVGKQKFEEKMLLGVTDVEVVE